MDWETLYCPKRHCHGYGKPFSQGYLLKSLFEKYQAASRLSIKRVIATYTNVSLVLGNSS